MYKVDKDLEMPEIRGRGREAKYPFAQMEPGDSFMAPKTARAAAYMYGKRTGTLFTSRVINERNVRIWRIA